MVIKNKILILLFALFFANTAFAQHQVGTPFTVSGVTYKITSTDPRKVEVSSVSENVRRQETVEIPAQVSYTYDNQTYEYTVTAIGKTAFKGCNQTDNIYNCNNAYNYLGIKTIILPNTITSIGEKAFICCTKLESINIPESVTSIGDLAFWGCEYLRSIVIPEGITTIGERTFRYCINLTSVTLPSTLTTIGTGAFKYCESLTTITIPANVTSIGSQAFEDCKSLTTIICLGENPPILGSDVFGGDVPDNVTLTVPCNGVGSYQDDSNWNSLAGDNISSDCNYVSVQSGEFNNPATWGESAIISVGIFTIKQEHTVTIPENLTVTITNNLSIVNNGVLRIAQGGQLINNTETNVGGIIEVETPVLSNSAWSFIGAPFTGEGGQYKLETVIPGTNDVSISVFDYYGEGAGAWSVDWATIDTLVGAGEGFFAWSFANEKVAFTTYGDGMYSPNANSSYESYTYDFTQTPKYQLNNGDVTVTKPLTNNNGYWMALANPYPAKLDVATFLEDHTITTTNTGFPFYQPTTTTTPMFQGGCIYKFNGTSWIPNSEDINVTEGFFVNCSTANGNIVFSKNQLVNYSNQAKSSSVQREFVKLAMVDGEKEVEVLFAHNESAKQEYDIFDANKLFSPVEVAEPYFVTDGKALVKEEVKQLPYYATMNVRSYENKEITFKATNIPAGIIVRIIDGEEMITLSEDATYTTTITAGENADRFKVLFEQARQLTDLIAHNITITNHNRTINIATAEENLTIKVYNALGQEVLTTKDYNFTLSEVPAGAYMIKAFNKTVSETAKIVVK